MIASMVSPTKTKRRHRLTAKLLVVVLDLVLAGLALYFSWWLRYEMEDWAGSDGIPTPGVSLLSAGAHCAYRASIRCIPNCASLPPAEIHRPGRRNRANLLRIYAGCVFSHCRLLLVAARRICRILPGHVHLSLAEYTANYQCKPLAHASRGRCAPTARPAS